MSKSPISILQEYMVKSNQSLPTYDCIEHNSVGLNDHEFKVRVKCGSLTADGRGTTKKDAKNNAAKELLLQIGGAELAKPRINNNSTNNNKNNEIGAIQENNSTNCTALLKSGSSLNYIGLLHEHCAQKSIPAPTFVEVHSWGPSHMMNFTIRCQVSDIIEEATATTKKTAKTDSARKVWFKLSKMRFDPSINKTIEEKVREAGVEVRDLKLEDILPDYTEVNQVAKDKYLNLTKLKPSAYISDRQSLENCHQLIAAKYSLSLRESIIAQLSQITEDENNVTLLPIFKLVLQKIANLVGVKLDRVSLMHRKLAGQYTVGFRLHTKPPIVSICTAETECLAEFKAIVKIAMDFQILLC
ncbi:interferon-inducible double-stranded RNA-dependent protein kinase activator A homolog [Belonocnema kinseyi]|uniref:interferon-inducible double-stranded RNA-dependent protein kinase activator A homolog n=1 Tax=Belonocnema kinseyi TaxID=2817044 RepID=UPI00143CF405|nr:interferon-inducible double-stranded RNA-dependent protein kinase activator A homolog [Belonocnema kinseyi]XP_033220166.1 interferon-inducible double-stranded RNA-dependent protein kinase activator A homolog [Belonocnema kinseyi]